MVNHLRNKLTTITDNKICISGLSALTSISGVNHQDLFSLINNKSVKVSRRHADDTIGSWI